MQLQAISGSFFTLDYPCKQSGLFIDACPLAKTNFTTANEITNLTLPILRSLAVRADWDDTHLIFRRKVSGMI